jgi:hypothetical protein
VAPPENPGEFASGATQPQPLPVDQDAHGNAAPANPNPAPLIAILGGVAVLALLGLAAALVLVARSFEGRMRETEDEVSDLRRRVHDMVNKSHRHREALLELKEWSGLVDAKLETLPKYEAQREPRSSQEPSKTGSVFAQSWPEAGAAARNLGDGPGPAGDPASTKPSGRRRAGRTPDDAAKAISQAPAFLTLMGDYRGLLSGAARTPRDFIDRYRPLAASAEDEDGQVRLARDGDAATAPLWFVELADTDGMGVLLPGFEAIKNWGKSYRTWNGGKARTTFRAAFALHAGKLAVTHPAIVARVPGDPGSARLVSLGDMSGL